MYKYQFTVTKIKLT